MFISARPVAAFSLVSGAQFVRLHRTTRVTPAMAAGVSDRLWTLDELVEQTSR
jgi:hypothetical protein